MDKEIINHFTYDSSTGDFIRNKSGKYIKTINNQGYKVARYKNKTYLVHRIIWFLYYGYIPKIVDHINGNRLDNRIVNLRNVNALENARNHSKNTLNTSGKCGVSFCNYYNKWVAYIDVAGKRKNLGYSKTKKEAIIKRKSAELKFYGYEIRG